MHVRSLAPRLLASAALAAAGASCSLIPADLSGGAGVGGGRVGDAGVPYPGGCAAFDLSPERCEAIVDAQAAELGIDRNEVASITLLGDAECGEGTNVLCTRTMQFVVRVRFTTLDGGQAEGSQFCGVGGQFTLLCTDAPEIRLSSPIMGGYRDIPCAGEAPDGCASPVPTISPSAADAARPLLVAALDLPLDHVGTYEIPLGAAILPNGILTDASFSIPDPHQAGFTLADGAVSLVVTGEDGVPLWNAYEHGWRDGLERVEASLVFEVTAYEPGTTLSIRDVVVK